MVASEMTHKQLALMAETIREDIINMLVEAGSGHSAGPLDLADISLRSISMCSNTARISPIGQAATAWCSPMVTPCPCATPPWRAPATSR